MLRHWKDEQRASELMADLRQGKYITDDDMIFLDAYIKNRQKSWSGMSFYNGLRRAIARMKMVK